MEPIERYSSIVTDLIAEIEEKEKSKIKEAAEVVADKTIDDRLIHVFGPGHGAMAAEEMFFRAGGLVPINPIFDDALSLSHVLKCVEVEHIQDYTNHNLDYYNVEDGDVLIIVNYVAVEPATISMAIEARDRGVTVVGITSSDFCKTIPSDAPVRHSSKKDLSEVSNIFIDTHVPPGDGVISIEGIDQKISPVSTFAHAFIVNSIVAQTVKNMVDRGVEPPVLMSTSLPNAEEKNQKYLDKYSNRIKHL